MLLDFIVYSSYSSTIGLMVYADDLELDPFRKAPSDENVMNGACRWFPVNDDQ